MKWPAIGQLNITLEAVRSAQVDQRPPYLLAMVDDFRCVVIKLAERICNLIAQTDKRRTTCAAAAKEYCQYLCATGEPFGDRSAQILGRHAPLPAARHLQTDRWATGGATHRSRAVHQGFGRRSLRDENVRHQGRSQRATGTHLQHLAQNAEREKACIDELFDVRAVRIIADKLQDC